VQESQERIRVATSNSGYKFPTKKVIVNLAPANLSKEGAAFGLPIALARVRGALSMAEGARREGLRQLVLPEANALEAAAIGEVEVYEVRTLGEAVDFLGGRGGVFRAEPARDGRCGLTAEDDFADVAGQRYAKRALEEVAAAPVEDSNRDGTSVIRWLKPPGSRPFVSNSKLRCRRLVIQPDSEQRLGSLYVPRSLLLPQAAQPLQEASRPALEERLDRVG
jgi:Subunit ChlI of Mg-chelatase